MAPSSFQALVLFVAFATVCADTFGEHSTGTVFTVPVHHIRREIQLDDSEPLSHDYVHPMVYPDITTTSKNKYGESNLRLLGNTVEYFAAVLIGSPGQTFSLQVDTGSAITAIPSIECPDCYHYNPSYNSSASSTSKIISCSDDACSSRSCNADGTCAFSVSYGDNSGIQGKLVSDVLALPADYSTNTGPSSGKTISSLMSTVFDNTPVVFGSITKQTSAFQQAGADGIMGLAYGGSKLSCVPNCASLVMDVLVQQWSLPDVFSLSLSTISSNAQYNNPGGSLTIGGIDASILAGASIFYTPVVSKPYYSVAIGDIQVGGVSIGASISELGQAVVDSGTSYMLIPDGPYQKLKQVMQQDCTRPFVCGDTTIFDSNHCVDASAVNLNSYPTMSVYLDQIKLDMLPSQYMVASVVGGKNYYCFGIISGGSTPKTILGNTFMRGYYTIFDRGNQRVGFANSALVSPGPRVVAPSNAFPIAIVAGAAAGGLALVLAVVALVVIIRIRRSRRMKRENGTAEIETNVSTS